MGSVSLAILTCSYMRMILMYSSILWSLGLIQS